jgi:hypothetical protein
VRGQAGTKVVACRDGQIAVIYDKLRNFHFLGGKLRKFTEIYKFRPIRVQYTILVGFDS